MSRASPLQISDHALLRFMDRGGDMNVEGLRESLRASLARAHHAACSIGAVDYLISADGLLYVVRGDVVITVLPKDSDFAAARAIAKMTE